MEPILGNTDLKNIKHDAKCRASQISNSLNIHNLYCEATKITIIII